MTRIYSPTELPSETTLPGLGITVGGLIDILNDVAQALGFNSIFKVRVLLESEGLEVSNILYYRTEEILPAADLMAGVSDLAYQINQEVIPRYRSALPSYWQVKGFEITPFSQIFEIKSNPLYYPVNAGGQAFLVGDGNTKRQAVRIVYSLTPEGFLGRIQNIFRVLPRRGYIYVPVGRGDITAGEGFGGANRYQGLADKLKDPLFNADPPVNFIPLRVKRLGFDLPVFGRVNLYTGYARITESRVSTEVSFMDKWDI